MDQEDITALFEEKYHSLLGKSYEEWGETSPQNETEAYARLEAIDHELKTSHDLWADATGEEKEQLQDYRDKLRAEYEFIEAIFNLEAEDANW